MKTLQTVMIHVRSLKKNSGSAKSQCPFSNQHMYALKLWVCTCNYEEGTCAVPPRHFGGAA